MKAASHRIATLWDNASSVERRGFEIVIDITYGYYLQSRCGPGVLSKYMSRHAVLSTCALARSHTHAANPRIALTPILYVTVIVAEASEAHPHATPDGLVAVTIALTVQHPRRRAGCWVLSYLVLSMAPDLARRFRSHRGLLVCLTVSPRLAPHSDYVPKLFVRGVGECRCVCAVVCETRNADDPRLTYRDGQCLPSRAVESLVGLCRKLRNAEARRTRSRVRVAPSQTPSFEGFQEEIVSRVDHEVPCRRYTVSLLGDVLDPRVPRPQLVEMRRIAEVAQ